MTSVAPLPYKFIAHDSSRFERDLIQKLYSIIETRSKFDRWEKPEAAAVVMEDERV